MKTLILSIAICIGALTSFAQNSSHQELAKNFDKNIPSLLEQYNVPGMAIAVIQKGEVILEKGYGWANASNKKPINDKTGFNIGSISKTFTAWGIMNLVEEGKLDLDSPVSTYLTRWQFPSSEFDKNKVTIRSLLGHTGGVSVHGYPGFPTANHLPSLEESLNGVNGPVRADEKVELIIAPNTKFKYSGGGYTILQLVIEEVTGQSFDRYMEKEIFKPLQMKNTSFRLTKDILKKSATPYNEEGKQMYMVRFTAQAAAGLQTTLEDLIKFIKASFLKTRFYQKRVSLNLPLQQSCLIMITEWGI